MMPSGVADTQVALVSATKPIVRERCIVVEVKVEGKKGKSISPPRTSWDRGKSPPLLIRKTEYKKVIAKESDV